MHFSISAEGHADIDAKKSFLNIILPKLSGSLSLEGSKSSKATDTIKVVSTKSTVLAPIAKKATEVKKINDTALLKALYLSTFEATKKWTLPIHNWGKVYGELAIMYEGRLPD